MFARTLLLFGVLMSLGCPSPAIRTAETLAPGQWGGGVGVNFSIPVLSSALPEPAPIDIFNGLGVIYYLSVGLPGACEATLGLSMISPYAEARCGIVQERLGGPLSIAPGIGVMYNPPLWGGQPLEVRGWVDVSKRLGDVISPLARIEYRWGTIFKHVYRGHQGLHREQGPYVFEPTSAGLIQLTLGGAVHLPTSEQGGLSTVLLGVSPYWVVHTPDPELSPEGWGGTFGFEFQ